jgi:hypothetical protein
MEVFDLADWAPVHPYFLEGSANSLAFRPRYILPESPLLDLKRKLTLTDMSLVFPNPGTM